MREAVKNAPAVQDDTADFDSGDQTIPVVLRLIDGHWHLSEP
jgi:hypothetical protein